MSVIEIFNVWENYQIKFVRNHRVFWEDVWALKDISFDVPKGQVLGIMGENGAGKTTLLKLISGRLVPDKGTVNVKGKVSLMMELGAGFNPDFTGRENLLLNAQAYGLGGKQLEEQIQNIIEFADLGRFIDALIKYYSQGMYMRLAFALSVFVDPEILLIDDILAVGDEYTQKKCISKIFEFKNLGKTIVVVSHDSNMINKLCDRAIVLGQGKVVKDDIARNSISYYISRVGNKKGIASLEIDGGEFIFNNGRIMVVYNEIYVTSSLSGYLAFFDTIKNRWSSSADLSWEILKLTDKKIFAKGISSSGKVAVLWKVFIADTPKINLEIDLNGDLSDFKQVHLDICLENYFEGWASADRNGRFPPFVSKNDWHKLDSFRLFEGILGVYSRKQSNGLNLIFNKKDSNKDVSILNSGYEDESRIIQWGFEKKKINLGLDIPESDKSYEGYIDRQRGALADIERKEREAYIRDRTLTAGDYRIFVSEKDRSIDIYYKDKKITAGRGIECRFSYNGKWYDFSDSRMVLAPADKGLIVNVFLDELGVGMSWAVLEKEKCLHWDFNWLSGELDLLGFIEYTILLNPFYKEFFFGPYGYEDISSQGDMKGLGKRKERVEVGVRPAESVPGLIIENKSKALAGFSQNVEYNEPLIFNLGLSRDELRANRSLLSASMFCCNNSEFDKYIRQEKNRILMEEEREKCRLVQGRTICSENSSVFVDDFNKVIRVYFKNEEITSNKGLYNEIHIQGKKQKYVLSDADWQVDKISERKIDVRFSYSDFSQLWELYFESYNEIYLVIKYSVHEKVLGFNQELKLELGNIYNKWRTPLEEGMVSAEDIVDGFFPIRLKDNRISQVELRDTQENGKKLSNIYFESDFNLVFNLINLYMDIGQNYERFICINNCSVLVTAQYNKDDNLLFKGKFLLGKSTLMKKKNIFSTDLKLKKGKVETIFDRGRLHIFWQGKELTSGLGGYTSIRNSGVWVDSSQGYWERRDQKKDQINIVGRWSHLPLTQFWSIKFINSKVIDLLVWLEVHREINIELMQTCLMCTSEYNKWVVPGIQKGRFLNEYTSMYDILPFRFWYGRTSEITAVGDSLPRISLMHNSEFDNLKGIVENTDSLYKSRLFQFQKEGNLKRGRYSYFKGGIIIE